MRVLFAASVGLVLLVVARPTAADEPPGLWENGAAIELRDGLSVRPDGVVWITRRDLTGGLGVVVRALIPAPDAAERRTPRRRAPTRRVFVLSQHDHSVRFDEARLDMSIQGNEAFPLAATAKALGWSLKQREGGFDLLPSRRRPRRGTKPGDRFPDVVGIGLDGKPRSIASLRGKRVLIVVWASWSLSRVTLSTWATEWKLRQDQGLELLAVAVDVEGVERVRPYVPPGIEDRVLIDRDGVMPGLIGSKELGRFVLLDDLGVVRARGDLPNPSTIQWIARHLDEPLASGEQTAVAQPEPKADLATLRNRIERKPDDADARAALVDLLEAAGDLDAAAAELGALWRLRKLSPALAMRLARIHLDRGAWTDAMAVLDETRRGFRNALWLRRQRWALIHAERFYSGAIDTEWLARTIKAENEELGPRRRRR